jgi:hypothetical protein
MKKKTGSRLHLSEQLTHAREIFRYATRNLMTQRGPRCGGSDMNVSSVIFTLVLLGTILAGHTEHPVFWLLVGPAPLSIGFTAIIVLRRGVGQNQNIAKSRSADPLKERKSVIEGISPADQIIVDGQAPSAAWNEGSLSDRH